MALSGGGEGLDLDGSVAVVGGSLAGLRSAQALRRGGFRGRLRLIGAEAHLPYDRPPLSKQVLAGAWESQKTGLIDRAALDELGIDAVLGHRAVGLDADAVRLELDDGALIEADGIVVATGAVPRHPFAEQGVGVLRTLEDCAALRASVLAAGPGCCVVVIGAGFIGSEVAATCAGLGCAVKVVEMLLVPMAPAVGETIGAALGALHARNGVELVTGAAVEGVRRLGGGLSVSLGDRELEADVVVAGIGVVPETGWLGSSGLALDNGVVCDESLFAADRIVAAGDVARWPFRGALTRIEHWQMAADMGEAAAAGLLAGRARAAPFVPVPYFWSDQYGLKIQMLGRPQPDDEVVVVDGALDDRFVALYRHDEALSAAVALSRPRQLMAYRPLLEARASFDEALALAGS